jgi:PAS domain S-box-containing protein
MSKKLSEFGYSIESESTKLLIQQAEEKERERLFSLFKQAPIAIAILKGPDHVYEFSNPLTNEILKVVNPIGKSVKELFPDNKEILAMLDRTYETGEPFNVSEYPINLEQKGGAQTIYVNATYQPLRNGEGKIIGIMTTGFDVTKQVVARKKLEKSNEAQERLAAVVESSDDAIISQNISGIIETWNKGAEQLYGYKSEEIIGKPVSVLIPPEKKDDFPMIIKQLKQGRKVEHYETKRMTKNGRIVDVSITISPIRNDEGKIIGASKVARDITDRKKSEEKQKFLQKASSVLGSSIDYETTLKNLAKLIVPQLADYCRIVVAGESNQVKEINVTHADSKKLPLVKELYEQYKNSSNNRAGVGAILKSGKSEMISKITPEVLSTAKPRLVEIIKELNLQSYMGAPMKIGNRTIGALTFSSTDPERLYTKDDLILAEELARRSALAIENSRLYAESQRAVSLRDEFISVASHELKTPVTSLKLYIQLIKKQAENRGEDTKNLEKMDIQVNKLTGLIQDLLNVSRFQSGKLEYHDEEFDIDDVVDEAIDTIQPTTEIKIIKIDGKNKHSVWGDKDRISQVVANLLTNAIKYSPNADKVIVSSNFKKEFAEVTVQDFGIGIDKKHLPKLFQRFYRVADSTEKTFPGLGLGLYICKEIIKRYGGQMKVVSTKGKGSKFSFSLPYKATNHLSQSQTSEIVRSI